MVLSSKRWLFFIKYYLAAKSEIIAGVVFLFVLPHPLYNHKTYFSENALLPGLVTGEFSEERAAAR